MDLEHQNGSSDPSQEVPEQKAAVPQAERDKQRLQYLGDARRRQGLSIRCVAQRLQKSVAEVRAQEAETADLPISELYRWQQVLDVPMEELLTGPDDSLSPRVLNRARLLRIMKTARSIRNQAHSEPQRRLARLLISQLLEIMPELKDVTSWPTVGHRRTADEVGRIGENPVSDNWIMEST